MGETSKRKGMPCSSALCRSVLKIFAEKVSPENNQKRVGFWKYYLILFTNKPDEIMCNPNDIYCRQTNKKRKTEKKETLCDVSNEIQLHCRVTVILEITVYDSTLPVNLIPSTFFFV